MLKHNVINNTNATSFVEDVRCSSLQSLQSEMSVDDSERRELMGKLLKYAAYTLPFGDRIDVVVEGPFSVHKSHNLPQNIHDTNPPTRAKFCLILH